MNWAATSAKTSCSVVAWDARATRSTSITISRNKWGTLGNTPTEPSAKRKFPPDGIVELQPPPEMGFGGTTKLYAIESAALIEELIKRGYTRVER